MGSVSPVEGQQLKQFSQVTQAVQSSNSSSSVSEFKRLSKLMQTSQLADADVSISLQIRLRQLTQPYQLPDAAISVTQRSLHTNKFYVIIYHPSRFASVIYLNMLICRYLNGVTDTSETDKTITLSITIWGYPSRFSHYTTPKYCISLLKSDGWHQRKVNVNYK